MTNEQQIASNKERADLQIQAMNDKIAATDFKIGKIRDSLYGSSTEAPGMIMELDRIKISNEKNSKLTWILIGSIVAASATAGITFLTH
jgi:hypothetical protein